MLADAAGTGVDLPATPVEPEVLAAIAPVLEFFADAAPTESAVRGLMAWSALLGMVSQEVFGHRRNVITPDGAADFSDGEMRRTAAFLGLDRRPAEDPGHVRLSGEAVPSSQPRSAWP